MNLKQGNEVVVKTGWNYKDDSSNKWYIYINYLWHSCSHSLGVSKSNNAHARMTKWMIWLD